MRPSSPLSLSPSLFALPLSSLLETTDRILALHTSIPGREKFLSRYFALFPCRTQLTLDQRLQVALHLPLEQARELTPHPHPPTKPFALSYGRMSLTLQRPEAGTWPRRAPPHIEGYVFDADRQTWTYRRRQAGFSSQPARKKGHPLPRR